MITIIDNGVEIEVEMTDAEIRDFVFRLSRRFPAENSVCLSDTLDKRYLRDIMW